MFFSSLQLKKGVRSGFGGCLALSQGQPSTFPVAGVNLCTMITQGKNFIPKLQVCIESMRLKVLSQRLELELSQGWNCTSWL